LLLEEIASFPGEFFLFFMKVSFSRYFICFIGNFFAP
jgi:hypothetical protein